MNKNGLKTFRDRGLNLKDVETVQTSNSLCDIKLLYKYEYYR